MWPFRHWMAALLAFSSPQSTTVVNAPPNWVVNIPLAGLTPAWSHIKLVHQHTSNLDKASAHFLGSFQLLPVCLWILESSASNVRQASSIFLIFRRYLISDRVLRFSCSQAWGSGRGALRPCGTSISSHCLCHTRILVVRILCKQLKQHQRRCTCSVQWLLSDTPQRCRAPLAASRASCPTAGKT